jgi:hypothetical protein
VHGSGLLDRLELPIYRPSRAGPRDLAVAIASSDDGAAFTTVASVHRNSFGAASLERPALVRRADAVARVRELPHAQKVLG